MNNRLFHVSIFFSAVIHLIVVTTLSGHELKIFQRPINQIEVSYYHDIPEIKKLPKPEVAKEAKIVKKSNSSKKVDLLPKQKSFSREVADNVKNISKLSDSFMRGKKLSPKMSSFGKKKISISELSSEKITDPQYLSYRGLLRGDLVRWLENNWGDLGDQTGQVYLKFIVLNNGYVKDVKVDDQKSLASAELKQHAMHSIRACSPFPPITGKYAQFPEISFNILIKFNNFN